LDQNPQLCDAKRLGLKKKGKASVGENGREFIDDLKAQFSFCETRRKSSKLQIK
jgi:hypothetical protein